MFLCLRPKKLKPLPVFLTQRLFFPSRLHLEAHLKQQLFHQDPSIGCGFSVIRPDAWKVVEFDRDKLLAVAGSRGIYSNPNNALRVFKGKPSPHHWEAREFLPALASDKRMMTNCSVASWLVWFNPSKNEVRWAKIILEENGRVYDKFR